MGKRTGRGNKVLTPDQELIVAKLWREYHSARAIGERLGCGSTTVFRIKNRLGIQRDPTKKRCRECKRLLDRKEFPAIGSCLECQKYLNIARAYGLRREEYEQLKTQQGGVCAICQSSTILHVDHDHDTFEVRGLLCFNCNSAIGKFHDDPKLLRAAIQYLNR